MLSTYGAEHHALTEWAWKDPGLRPAIDGWKEAEEVLGPRPTTAAAPQPGEPPELKRIAAIGGYAAALAEEGIHTPEALQRMLRTTSGTQRVANVLDVDVATVELWKDLLELLEIAGIGPAHLNLFEAAGVTHVSQLLRERPERLHRHLAKVNRARELVRTVPSAGTLAEWQRQARRA